MKKKQISRRDLLKRTGATLAAAAAMPDHGAAAAPAEGAR